ncbi:epoxide hydrolase-like protein [Phyllosticta capitalensis]|uniref:Epoxide hydrolase-like protein n=1 Tax=Phyllosticta capitalensis TaxID=121624 RepID=A0ABR1YKY8_9PEZI
MMSSSSPPTPRTKALLFDIGGVVVLSPLAAITTYEQSLNLPAGYINSAIAAAAPNGAFQRLERGEMRLDDAFFEDFGRDVRNRGVWARMVARRKSEGQEAGDRGSRKEDFDEATQRIDAKALFWTMMRAARHPDPHVFPAVQALVALGRARSTAASPSAAERNDAFVVGALSNAVVFPEGVRDERGELFDAGVVLGRPESGATATATCSSGGGGASAAIPPLFDTFLHSAHLGLRKPDPRVYALALERLTLAARERGVVGADERLRPDEVLFLDDIGANLKVARECGLRTCKVEIGRTQEAVRVLEGAVGVERGALVGAGGGRGAKL